MYAERHLVWKVVEIESSGRDFREQRVANTFFRTDFCDWGCCKNEPCAATLLQPAGAAIADPNVDAANAAGRT